jgi:acylphosphatase
MNDRLVYQVWISGKVQGVGYRYATQRMAQKLGVTGWVQNLPDGRVEAMFAGSRAQVEAMIQWCYEGSREAQVEKVEFISLPDRVFYKFEIRR